MPWRRKWQPILISLSRRSHGQKSLVGYSPRGCQESDTAERLSAHTHLRTWWTGFLLTEQYYSPEVASESRIQAPAISGVLEAAEGASWVLAAVFSLSSRLTNGINQSSETWQFSPNRPIFPFSLISLMLWKTPEAKGSQASEAEEGRFSTGCLVQACHLYREHLLPILRPSSPASSPSWYPPDPPAPSKWAFGGVWWRLRSASKPPPTLLPTHFGYCLDGGGDWINKAVKSSNVAHRKGFRARKRQLPLLSALEQKIVSCT